MPPDPPNSLICSVFLAHTAAGPLQCECLEPPVSRAPPFLQSPSFKLAAVHMAQEVSQRENL